MPKSMPVSLTEDLAAVKQRRKRVIRQLGWWKDHDGRRILHPGDRLILSHLVHVAEVEVVGVRREPLSAIHHYPEDAAAEGHPDWTPKELITAYRRRLRCGKHDQVTRIEWNYVDEDHDAATELGREQPDALDRLKAVVEVSIYAALALLVTLALLSVFGATWPGFFMSLGGGGATFVTASRWWNRRDGTGADDHT